MEVKEKDGSPHLHPHVSSTGTGICRRGWRGLPLEALMVRICKQFPRPIPLVALDSGGWDEMCIIGMELPNARLGAVPNKLVPETWNHIPGKTSFQPPGVLNS